LGQTTTPYYPAVYRVEGKLYTQAIKLIPGTYTVEEFFLYQEKGTNSVFDQGTDLVVMAAPATGSPYAVYTTPDPSFEFTVNKFAKTQVGIQVLCFDAQEYTNFGFGWFTIGEVILREACFFGDICITNPALYAGSIYAAGGVNVDEVAVTQVIVKRNTVEVPNSPFSNFNSYGNGMPLCVQYPDYVGQVDNFTLELQVWVPTTAPGTFAWQTYATLTAVDAATIIGVGAQGVIDYAIGTCSPNSTNIYPWLPAPQPPCNQPPITTKTIDGVYDPAEWADATPFAIQGGGTAYIKINAGFAYACFNVTGWTMGSGYMNGNLVGYGIWNVNNGWNIPNTPVVEFQLSTDQASWGGGGQTGTIDGGQVYAYRLNGIIQALANVPPGLECVTSWANGWRVTEVKVPIGHLQKAVCDKAWVVGGINYYGLSHWYPDYFPTTWNQGGEVTIVPMP